jgi:hypothetical protein
MLRRSLILGTETDLDPGLIYLYGIRDTLQLFNQLYQIELQFDHPIKDFAPLIIEN